jgi:thiamine kinase-like enzyme
MEPGLRAVVEAMPGWSSAARLSFSPIPGGITNRNFKVDVDGSSYVVRIPGAGTELLGIDRGAEHAAARAAAAAGVGPEVIGFLPEHGSLITRFVDGRAIDERTMSDPPMLRRVTSALRSLHGSPSIPASFSPFRVVERYREVAKSLRVPVPPAHGELLERARQIEEALGAFSPRLCHNDLLNANFLRAGNRVFIVDYEYAGMGDIFFDLANFSVNHSFEDAANRALLEAYFGDATGRDLARLKLMRVMSDFREAMWGVVQQGLSTLEFDYVGYAQRHFDRCRGAVEDERYDRWLRGAREGR